MAVRLSKVGRERNCLLKASQRLVVPSKPIACAPQQNMRAGVARIARQRLACKLGAFGMMVALPLFMLAASSSPWRRQAKALAWVAAGCGQGFAWGAAAGYVPQALTALSQRRQELPAEKGA